MLHAVRELRGLLFHPILRDSTHPWIRALVAGGASSPHSLDSHRVTQALHEELHLWQPENAAVRLGLTYSQNHPLLGCPPWAAVLPWEDFTISESVARQREGRLTDTRQYGIELPIDFGSEAFGPSAEEVIRLCVMRLIHILQQIWRAGLDPEKGRMRVTSLQESYWFGARKERRLYVVNGQHRAAVYGALGMNRVPVRIGRQIITRRDVETWPGVKRGYFSADEAESVFIQIFAGSGV